MFFFRAHSSQDRQCCGDKKLLRGNIEGIMHYGRDALPHTSYLLAQRVDRELEIARVLVNGLESHPADLQGNVNFRSRLRSASHDKNDRRDHKIRRSDNSGRPDDSDRALQGVVACNICHSEPENADESSKEEQAEPACQNVEPYFSNEKVR